MTRNDAIIRFFEWSLLDTEHERREQFPVLRAFSENGSREFFRIYNSLSSSDQPIFMRSLVRRAHEYTIGLMGQSLTPEDRRWVSLYLSSNFMGYRGSDAAFSASRMKRLLKNELASLMPDKEISPGHGGIIMINSACKGGIVQTSVDVGGRSKQVSFGHWLSFGGTDRLIQCEDPLHWLGIGRSQWIGTSEGQVEIFARVISESMRRFSAFADSLHS